LPAISKLVLIYFEQLDYLTERETTQPTMDSTFGHMSCHFRSCRLSWSLSLWRY